MSDMSNVDQSPVASNLMGALDPYFDSTANKFQLLLTQIQVGEHQFAKCIQANEQSASQSQASGQSQMPQLINKVVSNVQAATINDVTNSNQSLTAPPLPPRKSSPNVADNSAINRMLKPQTSAPSGSNQTNASANLSTMLSKSSENVTSCEFEVPKSNAPPVPKHNVVATRTDEIDDGLKYISLTNIDDLCDRVIVGPAETISGIIDTRPLETRKPIASNMTLTSSSSSSAIDSNEQKLVASNCANNLYHLKVNMQQSQQRHQSYPSHLQSTMSIQQPSKSQTLPQLGMEYEKLCTSSSSSSTSSLATTQQNRAHSTTNANGTRNTPDGSSVYENIANGPYENINLDYISRLVNEGYSKDRVITALGISGNNIEMACHILHEFVSKSGT